MTAKIKSIQEMHPEDLEKRNEQVVQYTYLVEMIARKISRRLPSFIEVEDLINNGIIGLIDAINKFDDSKNIKFKTYAEFRINGAILDSLRKLDWIPKSVRFKINRFRKALDHLSLLFLRKPTDNELMEYLEIEDQKEFDNIKLGYKNQNLLSLEEVFTKKDSSFDDCTSLTNHISYKKDENPYAEIFFKEKIQRVEEEIKKLPKREKTIMKLHYHDDIAMNKIGTLMNLSKSRISQLHFNALEKIQSRIVFSRA